MRRQASRASIARLLDAAVLAGIVVAITACGHSAPTRYVTLNATPAQAPLATAAMAPVQLGAVHIPAVLDRPEVVTHVAPNRLAVDDNDRWGAPLGQMMRSTLAQDLLPRLPPGAFVFPDAPAPVGTRTLVVTVLDCNASAGGTLTLQVAWTLLAGQPARTTMSQEAALSAPVEGHDAAAQAAALSRVLGELAVRIAASIAVR
ncbi:membrane integrity-associated transporter subunit PqiC [Paraburkholderia sp. BR14312]|uniref:membrane integrity-associated transporter subunit PqiC n=1 Tax=Paraburkholderia sp. BR14312 TaxID=3237003 RepID=UPI0034CF0E6F